VAFELGTTFHDVHGTIQVREGDLQFDPASGAISGRIVVDATTASTNHKKRDQRMHNKVLESDQYPEIVLEPTGFDGELSRDGVSDLRISGVLRIHGADHELTIPAQVRVSGDTITGSGDFVVPYIEWGMKDPSVLLFRVKKEVRIHWTFQGTAAGTDVAWHTR
jgi:polyisoprenoid-binding protein YceI